MLPSSKGFNHTDLNGSSIPSRTSSTSSPVANSGPAKGERCVGCASTSAIRVHYNAPSCHGCKAFFRRSVFENRQYQCSNGGECDIEHESRNRCRACRFRKCLEGGMNPKQVREERAKNNGSTPDVVPFSDPERCDPPRMQTPKVESELTTFLCSLERETEQLTDDDANPDVVEWGKNVSLTLGLKNPRMVIKRSMVDWRCDRVMNSADIYSQWYRAFVLHADWAMGIPEFRVLSINDQTQLFKQNFMAFGWITYAYKSYEQGLMDKGLPLGNGSYIPYSDEDQKALEPRWALSYGVVCKKLIELIARPMKEMGMTFEEHCLVKAISLFQKDCPLTESGRNACNRAIDRLLEALAVHYDCKFPHLSQTQKIQRAMRCTLLLPSFNTIGQIEASMITDLSSVDLNQLSGVPMEILNAHRPYGYR